MKIAAIAAALTCLVSFVTAADERATMDVGMTSDQAKAPGLRGTSVIVPAGVITNSIDAKNNNVFVTKSNIVLSKSDRVQLAKIIKEVLATHPEADPAAANLILEQLEPDNDNRGTAGNVATNPAVVSNVVSSIFSAMTRNPAAATGHAVGAIAAAYPVIMAPTTGGASVSNPTRYIPPMTGTTGTSPYNTAGIGGLPAGISAPASPNTGAFSPSMTGGIGGLPSGISAPASPSS